MTVGEKVRLDSSGGAIERILVEDLGEVVRICREDEYSKAQLEGREPVTVGFPKSAIIK